MFQSLSPQRPSHLLLGHLPSGRQTMQVDNRIFSNQTKEIDIAPVLPKVSRRSLNDFQKSCSNWKDIFQANLANS